jgi:hypothetical protein
MWIECNRDELGSALADKDLSFDYKEYLNPSNSQRWRLGLAASASKASTSQ